MDEKEIHELTGFTTSEIIYLLVERLKVNEAFEKGASHHKTYVLHPTVSSITFSKKD